MGKCTTNTGQRRSRLYLVAFSVALAKGIEQAVLAPYSDSMKSLLKNGYTPKLRPSGHDISDKFGKDNGGSVPPNLIALANTESNGAYQEYCRANSLPVHPARFPAGIPEYFIRMLTDKNDLVVDPFAGSCVTGEVAEALSRRWACWNFPRNTLKAQERVLSASNQGSEAKRTKPTKFIRPVP